MVIGSDIESVLTQFIEEAKNLFGGKQKFNMPPSSSPSATQKPSENAIHSPGDHQSPIRATWYNVGTFSPSAVRHDDPKEAKVGRGHLGVDMSTSAGTPVYAFAPGVVTQVSTTTRGGNNISVKHDKGLSTYYAHLSTVAVHPGDKVDTSTVLGAVGNSGNAGDENKPGETLEGGRTFPHLHFEVHQDGNAVDPAKYITVPPYNAEYAKNPRKYLKFWANDKAKQDAQAFNMKGHLADRKIAFSRDVDRLMKISFAYYKIVK